MEQGNTSWNQSVTAVVIKEGKVLLARHTYGAGKGMLIIPGGYINVGESPIEAVKREYMEETRVVIEPKNIIGIRCNERDWYMAFSAEYVSGEATSDNDENSEVVWMEVKEALVREDVPSLTKTLIQCAMSENKGLNNLPFESSIKHDFGLLFGTL